MHILKVHFYPYSWSCIVRLMRNFFGGGGDNFDV